MAGRAAGPGNVPAFPALTGCGEEPPPPEPVIRPVRYQPVFSTGGERTRSFTGTARAAVESKLSFKVRGTLDSLAVEVGDKVKSGDLIAALDDKDLKLRLGDAQASRASADAQAATAQANFERVRKLYENSNASVNDYDAARTASVSAKEGARSAARRVELAQRELGYARLLAPADGGIAEVMVEDNENVQPDSPS